MVRERWSIEGWNCIRDTQLHEDAHLLSRRRRWGDGYAADSSPQPPPIGGISINPGGGGRHAGVDERHHSAAGLGDAAAQP
jgi:hypothetical protein